MNTFYSVYGRNAGFEATAPGRVNLIGEHTDYNGGCVLPTPIPQATKVSIGKRKDAIVHVTTDMPGGKREVASYVLDNEVKTGGWIDYVQGATSLLAKQGSRINGFDAYITSDVPLGAGLSSSAALLVALFKALKAAYALSFDDIQVALLSQQVENHFVGAHVGIMDQMAASLARPGTALWLNTATMKFKTVPLPAAKFDIFVINSGITHQHSEGGYNTRRVECEAAASTLGVKFLCELGDQDLPKVDELPSPLRERARHVITENARVGQAVRAIEAGDAATLGKLLSLSHVSLRDDFEVSIPQIDLLVRLADEHPAVFGSRITGGGFGGSIVGICEPGQATAVAADVVSRYRQAGGTDASVLVPSTKVLTADRAYKSAEARPSS